MSTGSEEGVLPGTEGGPSVFTEEEIASATAGPTGDAELEEVQAAAIEEATAPELESSFEKLLTKSRKLSPDRVKAVLQAILFVAEGPQSVDQLFEATGIERSLIQAALEKLAESFREGVSGIVLYEVAGGFQLRTDPESGEYVRRFLQVKPQRLTRAAVETLAIVAYRQPVTRPEIEDIRGVDCGAVMKALLDRKLVKILGKKEDVGRPILYGTTREFLEYFSLKDLASLPTLREFQELSEEHQEIVEQEAAAAPGVAGTLQELVDPTFNQKLEEADRKSQAVLDELESAMGEVEARNQEAAALRQQAAASPPDPAATEEAAMNLVPPVVESSEEAALAPELNQPNE